MFYVFAEGQVQFLDGGRLDLGVVRDFTLDATNDFELFHEQFETVAFRGFASGAIQYISTLCATGASTGTQAIRCDRRVGHGPRGERAAPIAARLITRTVAPTRETIALNDLRPAIGAVPGDR